VGSKNSSGDLDNNTQAHDTGADVGNEDERCDEYCEQLAQKLMMFFSDQDREMVMTRIDDVVFQVLQSGLLKPKKKLIMI
jgi:hypothetical protein